MGRLKFALVLLLCCIPASPADVSEDSVKQAIADLARAAEQGDKPALDRLFHANLLYTHSNGLMQNKAAAIAGLAKRDHKYEYGDMQMHLYDKTAVVRLAMTAHYPVSKNPSAKLNVLLVWVRESDRWQLAARHVIKLPSAAVR